ncbi:CaiB/BaiF CoA transferase family protein [Tomitella biformata]|uniref:CaiB/BaiF CoA transferase family protein n=1 Tax=Tomitella biformata TaxID=630403 RepID=UPI00046685B2|nr:CoA transferase [Tomitella biformata]
MTTPQNRPETWARSAPAESVGPLSDCLVIDLSRALAGPHAAMMLGDLGARVIKVEAPGSGDDTRSWGPPFVADADGERHSTYFLSCNRNKESIALDLKAADGKDTLTQLVRQADVLVENFRPGVLDRLGFDVERLHELNPRLVVLSITGFGHDGPEGARPGYDQIAQGEAGLMSLTGPSKEEPTRVGVPIGDLLAGMNGAYGVVAALHERNATGRGRVVRTSLLAAIVGVHAFQGTRYTVAGEVPVPTGGHHPSICPYGLFRSSEGPVQIAVGSEGLWQRFAPAFGLDRPEWATNPQRVADRDAVNAAVDAAFAPFESAPLLAKLTELGIPAGRVRDLGEVYEWDQTKSQGLLIDVEHAALGKVTLPGPALRFDADEAGPATRTTHAAPPTLDQHGDSIRHWLNETSAQPLRVVQ